MTVKEFIFRLCLYIFIGGVLPFIFLVWRFDLFNPNANKPVVIGGWGIVAILFITIFFLKTLKAIRKGMMFSVWTRVIDAITKVFIPLLIAIVVVNFVGSIQKELFQFLVVVFLLEIPATAINPIPRWTYENKIEEMSLGLGKIAKNIKEHLAKSKGE